MQTSSIIAIGDELVSGFTLDTNSHWIAQRLRVLGYPVKRVSQIRDRPAEIVEQVHRELDDAEVTHIFLSGGLGPTPDDRTFVSLAEALGRELVIWEETRVRIERRVRRMHEAGLLQSPELTEGNLRMARIPANPALVFKNRPGMAPGVFVVRELRFAFAVEARFYPVMHELEQTFPDVAVGSYPNFETKELVIRVAGADVKRVEAALDEVRRRSLELGFTPQPA